MSTGLRRKRRTRDAEYHRHEQPVLVVDSLQRVSATEGLVYCQGETQTDVHSSVRICTKPHTEMVRIPISEAFHTKSSLSKPLTRKGRMTRSAVVRHPTLRSPLGLVASTSYEPPKGHQRMH